MRNISFMLTTRQFLDGSKDVTRRMGWRFLKPGDVLMAVEKSQGLGKGGKVRKLGQIRVKSVATEPLEFLTEWLDYGFEECRREGFPTSTPQEFVEMFCKSHKRCTPQTDVTRIEFEHITLS